MKLIHLPSHYPDLYKTLHSKCETCCGLCCCALYCAKIEGFPENKPEGKPCSHLQKDFQCDIHSKLKDMYMKGCKAYDCFGAGQIVTQLYGDTNWQNDVSVAPQMFQVFRIVYQIQEMLGYLLEADTIMPDADIDALIQENLKYSKGSINYLLSLSLEGYHERVNEVLKSVCRKLRCLNEGKRNTVYLQKKMKGISQKQKDFSMCIMIGCDAKDFIANTLNFLGADLRDVDFSNADLRNTMFLTQRQLNSAKGNAYTILPEHLNIPDTWI